MDCARGQSINDHPLTMNHGPGQTTSRLAAIVHRMEHFRPPRYRNDQMTIPVLARLDHLICEVPDIHRAMRLFVDELGFPQAWPIGRFWPQALTSGVALGGINLEFLQPDGGGPQEATIRTLVFEPTDLSLTASYYDQLGFPMGIREKWEGDPELLRLRGYSNEEAESPRLICKNLVPTRDPAVGFFLCDYSPEMRARLHPHAFPNPKSVTAVVLDMPEGGRRQQELSDLWPLAAAHEGPEISLADAQEPEILEIRTSRGPLDLGGWATRFCLT
jgi:hypothetical protein